MRRPLSIARFAPLWFTLTGCIGILSAGRETENDASALTVPDVSDARHPADASVSIDTRRDDANVTAMDARAGAERDTSFVEASRSDELTAADARAPDVRSDAHVDVRDVADATRPGVIRHVDLAHPSADDANPGSELLPWRTIRRAAEALRPGETVWIHRGTYDGDVLPQDSGRADAPITYRAAPSDAHRVIIRGVFRIHGRDHLRVEGVRVEGGEVGFEILGRASHIVISGNHTYNTRGSGILAAGVRWGEDPGRFDWRGVTDLLIENNQIELACNGGYNENITIMNGAANVEIRGNHLFHPGDTTNGGEGIDLKEGVANARIHHNHVDGLGRIGIYLDAAGRNTAFAPPLLTNIEVYNNVVHDSPMGIAMTSEGTGSIDGVRIYNNVVYRNQRDGIGLYGHPEEAATNFIRNIFVYNNTAYGNSIEPMHPWWGGIHLTHARLTNCIVRNNIVWGNAGDQLKLDPGIVSDNNLMEDPVFVDAAGGDFHVRAGSRAIDSGSFTLAAPFDADDVPRPIGPAIDVGAYEGAR